MPSDTPTQAVDAAFCRDLLPRVSRTFALSIEALPASLGDAVRLAYLLCRVVDTIEDAAKLPSTAREALFDQFDDLMRDDALAPARFEAACSVLDDGDDGLLCRHAGHVFRELRRLQPAQREAVRPNVLEMSAGMREYTRRVRDGHPLRLDDMADLERYCYFVAGTVGNLLTALFEPSVEGLGERARAVTHETAVSFGLGLQMVNIVKDIATDFERDVCFIPRSLAAAHGLNLEELLSPSRRPDALAVVSDVCQRARWHLERATRYALAWPEESAQHVRLFCTVPLALALLTLRDVEQSDDTLRQGRVFKVSREQVGGVLLEAREAATSNARLCALLARCRPT